MTPEDLKKRLRAFALRCIRLAESFPKTPTGRVIGGQLIRSSTGAASNYRATCLARSPADFVSKMGVVAEETDESVFWIDFAPDAGLVQRRLVESLLQEGVEILKIVIASCKTAKSSRKVNRQ